MTKPHSDDADPKSDKPEGDSAAVGVRADAASERDTAEAQTTGLGEGDPSEPNDTENTAGAEDSGEAGTAVSEDADVEHEAQGVEPVKGKRRIGRRARAVTGARRGDADQPDEESAESEAKKPSDAADSSGEDNGDDKRASSSDDEAATSDDAQDDAEAEDEADEAEPAKPRRRISWSRALAYGVLPGVALLLAAAAGYLKWQDSSARASQVAGIEAVAAAKDSTIALLSYKSDTVEKDLDAAKSRLTGAFKESYSQLIKDVVIPGAKREHISTTATVPASASVSATPNHAVTLLFVNQSAVVGQSPPTDTTSSVRVTVDKVDGRWLISGFDPV
jgi:Mce-associated membrane protein